MIKNTHNRMKLQSLSSVERLNIWFDVVILFLCQEVFCSLFTWKWQSTHWAFLSHCLSLARSGKIQWEWVQLFCEYLGSPECAMQSPFPWRCSLRVTEMALKRDRHMMFQPPNCSPVCWVSNLTPLHFNAQTHPLQARLYDKQGESSWIIQAPGVSQLRWNSTGFARVENRL